MKQIHADFKKGEAKIAIQNLDDLWFLSQIIDKGDIVKGKTLRKIKLEGKDEKSQSFKKPVFLSIKVESIEFSKSASALRVSGITAEEQEDIPKGSYHTISVEENSIITIVKDKWLNYQIAKLKEACEEKSSKILICVLDREEAYFTLLKKYGYDLLSHISGDVEKKAEPHRGIRNSESFSMLQAGKGSFYHDVLKQLEDYSARYNLTRIILASPSFWKEELLKSLKNEELKKKIFLATCSSVDQTGINEVLKRPEVKEALKQDRVSKESILVEQLLTEIAKKGAAVYGVKEVEESSAAGAVSVLLLTDALIKKSREENYYGRIEYIMKTVDDMKGDVHIVSSDHDAGKRLNGLGGIGAILRYKMNYE